MTSDMRRDIEGSDSQNSTVMELRETCLHLYTPIMVLKSGSQEAGPVTYDPIFETVTMAIKKHEVV